MVLGKNEFIKHLFLILQLNTQLFISLSMQYNENAIIVVNIVVLDGINN